MVVDEKIASVTRILPGPLKTATVTRPLLLTLPGPTPRLRLAIRGFSRHVYESALSSAALPRRCPPKHRAVSRILGISLAGFRPGPLAHATGTRHVSLTRRLLAVCNQYPTEDLQSKSALGLLNSVEVKGALPPQKSGLRLAGQPDLSRPPSKAWPGPRRQGEELYESSIVLP